VDEAGTRGSAMQSSLFTTKYGRHSAITTITSDNLWYFR